MSEAPTARPAGPGIAARTGDRLFLLWFFLSGASALVYEVVWLRWLIHVFGATTLAVGTVLAVFMGGLAAGAWLGGGRAMRLGAPVRVYGILELVIGGAALVLPGLLAAVPPILGALGATEDSSFVELTLARFGLASALLAVPTTAMGATLPVLAQVAAPDPATAGSRVGRLYAANTAGAVLGAASAGFVLLPVLGALATPMPTACHARQRASRAASWAGANANTASAALSTFVHCSERSAE